MKPLDVLFDDFYIRHQIQMYSIYKTRTTAIIVSAIHFVNWSISTRATCSRFKSIEKHWMRIEPLFIRIAALSSGNIDESWKVPKEISLWWRVIGRKPRIFQQERYCFIRFTFTSQIVTFLTRRRILAYANNSILCVEKNLKNIWCVYHFQCVSLEISIKIIKFFFI